MLQIDSKGGHHRHTLEDKDRQGSSVPMLSDSVETAGASRMLVRSFVALFILLLYFVRGDDSILHSQPNEQAFLKMQPVCRLQKNDTARRIDDFIGDF